jgi:citryl-CoA lyase
MEAAKEHILYRTAIAKSSTHDVMIRGYSLTDLIGEVTLPGMLSLLVKGELPSKAEESMLDAILVACAEHGVRPPSIQAARQIASGGVQFQACVAGGVLALGDSHGGAVENIMEIFTGAEKEMREQGITARDMAVKILTDAKTQKKRIPGYGHPTHPEDPRTVKLMHIAKNLGIYGGVCKLAETMAGLTAEISGKALPLNVDGAVGAIAAEMGFPAVIGKGLFLLGRVFGISAHVLEEKQREKPMSHLPAANQYVYDGPESRPFPKK